MKITEFHRKLNSMGLTGEYNKFDTTSFYIKIEGKCILWSKVDSYYNFNLDQFLKSIRIRIQNMIDP